MVLRPCLLTRLEFRKRKVFVHLFQKVVGFKRAKPFDAFSRRRNALSSGAFEEVWNPFAREKGFKSRLFAEWGPEKFPVGSFRQ